MSDQEADSYRMAMQALDGQAREDYRNAQYEKLRQRALENGYRMPVTPPWAGQRVAPTGAAATPSWRLNFKFWRSCRSRSSVSEPMPGYSQLPIRRIAQLCFMSMDENPLMPACLKSHFVASSSVANFNSA